MSIIIKGMKLSDSCYDCRMRTDSYFCSAMPKEFCGYTDDIKRPDWCPLIELPPHVRLIDADILLDESEWYGERATYDNPMPDGEEAVSVESILNTPTIFEEEE